MLDEHADDIVDDETETVMNDADAVRRALRSAPRDADGAADEKLLVDLVADLIAFDVDKERHARAKRAIAQQRKPGATNADGQLQFPGFESYDYEPERLVLDDDGAIIENRNAKLQHKGAEARRTRQHAQRALVHADRREQEAARYAAYLVERAANGLSINVTFGEFVDAAQIHVDVDAPAT